MFQDRFLSLFLENLRWLCSYNSIAMQFSSLFFIAFSCVVFFFLHSKFHVILYCFCMSFIICIDFYRIYFYSMRKMQIRFSVRAFFFITAAFLFMTVFLMFFLLSSISICSLFVITHLFNHSLCIVSFLVE